MKKTMKRMMAYLLVFAMILSLDPAGVAAAARADVKLSKKSVILKKGKKTNVAVKAAKDCEIRKIRITKNSKKKVASVKVRKNKLRVTAKQKGTAKVTVAVSYRKGAKVQTKKLRLTVKVKNAAAVRITPKPVKSTKPSATPGPTSTPDNRVTRGNWIKTLCEEMSIDVSGIQADAVDYDFADIENYSGALQIEAAYRYGLLPVENDVQDVPYFYPVNMLTRDYMAYTLSRALGFKFDGELISCTDIGNARYQQEVSNVVKAGIMTLSGNTFSPNAYVTKEEVEQVKKKIREWNASADLSGKAEYDKSTYAAGVKDNSDCSGYTVEQDADGYTLQFEEDNAPALAQGDITILGANEEHPEGIALKVTEVTGNATYTCVAPDVEEVYTNIDLLGQGEVDYRNVKPADDDITVSYDAPEQTEEPSTSTQSLKGKNLKAIGGTFKPEDVKFTFDLGEGKTITDNLKLKGKVTVTIPEITALLDANVSLSKGLSVKELTLSMTHQIDIAGGLYWAVADSGQSLQDGNYENDIQGILHKAQGSNFEAGRLDLGIVPIHVAYGLGINIHFFAEISLKGEVSITYSINGTEGIQYKDNMFRTIFNFADTLSLFEVAGTGSLQIGLAVDLAFMEVFDVVGVTFQAGPAFNVKLTPHVFATDALVCANASLYLAAKITLDQETIVGEFLKTVLHVTVEHELLKDNENNPLRLNFHMENLKKVSKCTFGAGTITGNVVDSDSGRPIANAMVRVYLRDKDGSDLQIRKKFTDKTGSYRFDNLTDGTYTIVVTATGYKECRIDDVAVVKNSVNTADTARMIRRDNGQGQLKFKVVSAVTGEDLTGWDYEISTTNTYSNMADIKGTSTDAQFLQNVECGNYVVKISKEDYISTTQNINVLKGANRTVTIALSPKFTTIGDDDAIRFVLTWGEEPADLDSHVFIKNAAGGVVGHVYYSNKEYEDDNTSVNLDVDDRESYGPETITLEKTSDDYTYSYYVYDYTNEESSTSDLLSLSSAKGSVYAGSKLLYSFHVPYSRSGTAWKLFDYTPSNGGLTIYNQMGWSTSSLEFGDSVDWDSSNDD